MLLSKSAIYGLRASLYISSLKSGKYVTVRQISEELNISFHFLAKILQSLTQHGILRSFRGPNGGVTLAKPAGDIRLDELLNAIDGPTMFDECIMGLPGCGHEKPCPLHAQWALAQKQIKELFENTTLAEQADRIEELDLRLK
jgi:Rrf2 family transcriptional regulator, iron-sulfur cluster assembly transcription factor